MIKVRLPGQAKVQAYYERARINLNAFRVCLLLFFLLVFPLSLSFISSLCFSLSNLCCWLFHLLLYLLLHYTPPNVFMLSWFLFEVFSRLDSHSFVMAIRVHTQAR